MTSDRNFIEDELRLMGDEDGGVTVVCGHADHEHDTEYGIAYYGGGGDRPGVRYFHPDELPDLIDFINAHPRSHGGN